jgi:hypothetical protein
MFRIWFDTKPNFIFLILPQWTRIRRDNWIYQIYLALDASLSKQKYVANLSAPNITTYLPNFILFKGRARISTVYECLKEQITIEFLEMKRVVYLVNPDDERDLENKKQ